jgi:predicted NBD/HSP70 family sugar kinase
MAQRPYAIGVNVGGTKIAAGLVNRQGQILARSYTKEHSGHPPQVVVWDSAKVVLSQFWDDAGVIGAAEVAFEAEDARTS